MARTLYGIYGASGCGRGVMPIARQLLAKDITGPEEQRLVFIDDKPLASKVNGCDVLTYKQFLQQEATERCVAVAIADSRIRAGIAETLAEDGCKPMQLSASSTVIMDNVSIGIGSILSPFVTLTSNIDIGSYFHANIYSYVEHDCKIGNFVTFAPRVMCNGNVIIEDHVYVGAGAMIRQGRADKPLIVGEGAVIGMGSVVLNDVPAGATVVGNPARQLNKCGDG
jgi:sugar O-acyltransferase (sialic acid O-acetyltransferase NeuD family)